MESLFANNVLEVLAALFLSQEEAIHQSKIVALSKLRIIQVQRALQRLHHVGLIEEFKQGNMVYYKLQQDHPLFPELKNILYKTVLIAEPFKKAFKSVIAKISVAFIYGSFGNGSESVDSDIDVFIVGEIGLKEVSKLLSPISKQIKREINPVVYSRSEFIKQIKAGGHFVTTVIHSKKLWLIGDENELKKMDKRK
jgi:predicted nucleotidyltransferase